MTAWAEIVGLWPSALGAVIGAGAGAMGYAFTTRWPRPRRPRIGPRILASVGALMGGMIPVLVPSGRALPGAVVLAALLIPVCAVDLELRLIPDVITLPGTALLIVIETAFGGGLAPTVWAVIAASAFAIPAAAVPGSVGWGDVKLAAMIGGALGSATPVALAVALGVGGLSAAALLARHGRGARRRTLAFAPLLAVGALVGLGAG